MKDGRLSVVSAERKNILKSDAVVVIPDEVVEFNGITYQVSVISNEEYQNRLKIHKNLFNFCISYDMIIGDSVLRSRKIGDRIRPYKRGCGKTIKKLMNESKLSPCERENVPLLCDETGVLAVLGMTVDERVAVSETTKRILCVSPTE
ncbi:MAG: tRNA lysidine(34) synthetase TilS [Clostridia bacterium]|nr:tRNA lysidine(34) synthetase TilS [Clostridia bacterium]